MVRTEPMHEYGGFVYHISTECPARKFAQKQNRLTEGEGDKPMCPKCLSLLRRGKG